MQIKIFILLFIGIQCFRVLGQDTLKLEPSIYYSSDTYPVRGKSFASKAEYRLEQISFDNQNKRIEYCYYYDSIRDCIGENYQFIGDSILRIGDSSLTKQVKLWSYVKKKNNEYLVWRTYEGVTESGYVSRLVPFKKIGVFQTKNNSDLVLWEIDYTNYNHKSVYSLPKYFFPLKKVKKEEPNLSDVGTYPKLMNGDSLPTEIKVARNGLCYSEPDLLNENMIFTVTITSKGELMNIKPLMNVEYCPFYLMNIILAINKLGPVSPAILNGKPVNCKYTIGINEPEY